VGVDVIVEVGVSLGQNNCPYPKLRTSNGKKGIKRSRFFVSFSSIPYTFTSASGDDYGASQNILMKFQPPNGIGLPHPGDRAAAGLSPIHFPSSVLD